MGALRSHEHRFGPFVTWVATAAHGVNQLQTSRRLRKRLAPIKVGAGSLSPRGADAGISPDWLALWAPGRLGWWIAVLFMVGAACFAAGGARAGVSALHWIEARAINPIFFTGSVFFTVAAYLQFYEALSGDISERDARRRCFGWRPRNLGNLSAFSQLAGTLLFNVDTGDALISGLGWLEQDVLIWKPDIVGCLCFLVSSQLAIMEYAHG